MKKLFTTIATLVLLGAGCAPVVNSPPASASTTITYFVPPKDVQYTYCNGAEMDSAGYKKTLTQKVTKVVPGNLVTEEKIKTTLLLAKTDTLAPRSSGEITNIASTTFNNGTVNLYPYPEGAWAGVSIFACAWKPFVEKQLEQFPEVKKIEWKDVVN